jgi:hypothetical protein
MDVYRALRAQVIEANREKGSRMEPSRLHDIALIEYPKMQ